MPGPRNGEPTAVPRSLAFAPAPAVDGGRQEPIGRVHPTSRPATSRRSASPGCRRPGRARLGHPLGGCALRRIPRQPPRRPDRPVTLVIVGVLLVVERIWPAQRRPIFARGYRQDLLLHGAQRDARRAPRHRAHPLLRRVVLRASPWIVLPKSAPVPRWGAIALIFVAMDGWTGSRTWPITGSDALAFPRAAPLARGHERADGLSHASADPCLLSHGVGPGGRARGQRRVAATLLVDLRGGRGLRPLEHPSGLRTPRTHLREPQLPPDPPSAGRATRTSTWASP